MKVKLLLIIITLILFATSAQASFDFSGIQSPETNNSRNKIITPTLAARWMQTAERGIEAFVPKGWRTFDDIDLTDSAPIELNKTVLDVDSSVIFLAEKYGIQSATYQISLLKGSNMHYKFEQEIFRIENFIMKEPNARLIEKEIIENQFNSVNGLFLAYQIENTLLVKCFYYTDVTKMLLLSFESSEQELIKEFKEISKKIKF